MLRKFRVFFKCRFFYGTVPVSCQVTQVGRPADCAVAAGSAQLTVLMTISDHYNKIVFTKHDGKF
jgi:hypothetical protein